MDDELNIVLEDPSEIDIDLGDKLNIVPIDGAPHNKLGNLDYEHSGHTGFAPSRLENVEEVLDEDIENAEIFTDVEGSDKKISVNKIIDSAFGKIAVDEANEALLLNYEEE